MAFVNHTQTNLAQGLLNAGITAGQTTIVLQSGQGGLFPTTFPFKILIQNFDTQERPTKNEIATCTNRVSDTLTIARASEAVPASYSATTQTSTAFAFDSGDSVTLVLTAAQQKDVQDWLAPRLGTEGGNLTGPLEFFKGANLASAATTDIGAATGNLVHVTGTTGISSFGSSAQAGAAYTVVFDGACILTHSASFVLPGNVNLTTAAGDTVTAICESAGNWTLRDYVKADGTANVSSPATKSIANSFYPGENLAANDAVFLESFPTFAQAETSLVLGDAAARTRTGFKFIGTATSVTTMKLGLFKVGAPTDNLTVRIETDSAGSPSGTLAHANATANVAGTGLTTGAVDTTATFAGAFTLTAGVQYWILLGRSTAVNAANYYRFSVSSDDTKSFGYKLYDGAAYGAATATETPYALFTGAQTAVLAKCDADDPNFSRFLGFVPSATNVGTLATVTTSGVQSAFSGLVSGQKYYLSNTPGAISTATGTITSEVGTAVSTTEMAVGYFEPVRTYHKMIAKTFNTTLTNDDLGIDFSKFSKIHIAFSVTGGTYGYSNSVGHLFWDNTNARGSVLNYGRNNAADEGYGYAPRTASSTNSVWKGYSYDGIQSLTATLDKGVKNYRLSYSATAGANNPMYLIANITYSA